MKLRNATKAPFVYAAPLARTDDTGVYGQRVVIAPGEVFTPPLPLGRSFVIALTGGALVPASEDDRKELDRLRASAGPKAGGKG